MATALPAPQDETWLRDGVLGQIYRQPLTVKSIEASQQRAFALIEDAMVVPLVVVLEGEGQTIKLSIGQLGRVSGHKVVKHFSVIIIAGTKKSATMDLLRSASQLFFNNRIQYCDTLEQALELARPYVGVEKTILD
jgi:hypothetical protein